MIRWIMATQEEFNMINIPVEPFPRTIVMELPTGESKEYILQHFELADNDEKFEMLMAILPQAVLSDRTVRMLLPVD